VVAVVVVLGILLAVWKFRSGSSDDNDDHATGGAAAAGAAGSTSGSRSGGIRAPAAPASLSGHVTRKADGTGVPGAIVSVARVELGAMFNTDDTPTTIATTDATGAWSVPAIAPGTYGIGAAAVGLLPGMRDKLVVAPGAHETVDFALVVGGATVTGTVNDIGGGPIGGARVTMQRSSSFFGSKPELVALTGADGKYQLTLGDGSYSAAATHDDYTQQSKRFELAGKPLVLDFVLAPGGSIRGQVVSRDGKPVPGALVRATGGRRAGGRGGGGGGGGFGQHPPATTDASGNFVLKSLQSGAISLTATGRGFASKSPTVVELGIGEQVDGVRVVVDRAFSISGRAVRAGKVAEGVGGVRLGVFSIASGQSAMAIDPSADDGSFEIVGVQPASYMMFAVGEGVVPEIGKPIEVVDKDVAGVVVEMASGATLSGRVEPGAVASLGLELDQDKIGLANMFEAAKAMIVHADSDETGAFTMRAVPPGTFSIVASTTDGRKGKLPVTVTTVDQTNLVVKLEPRASFAGRVVDALGAPVSGVRVRLRAQGEKMNGFSMSSSMMNGGTVAGADGTFREVGLEAGKYNVSVSDDQGRLAWAKGDKRDEPLTYELSKGQEMTGVTLTVEARDGVIRGLVLGPDKLPVADAWVTPGLETKPSKDRMEDMVMMFRGSGQPVLTGEDGRFTITKLRRGTYTLVAESSKGTARAQKAGVQTGDTVTLMLESLGSITGKVTAGGAPVAAYDIGCRSKGLRVDMGDLQRHITAADGVYSLERLAPGEYTCSVTSEAGTASGTVTVANAPVQLDLALVGFASITGIVVSLVNGQPVANLYVLAGGDAMDQHAIGDLLGGKGPKTDAAGRFVVERVPVGKGNLVVIGSDSSFSSPLATREYTAVTGQRVDLGTIKVVPPRTGEAGTLGFSTQIDDGKLKVATLKTGGPAEAAGVGEGDRIVSIDGRLVSELGAETARMLVASGTVSTGQRVLLGLERAGAPLQIAVVAVKW
jgi:hypothetical protein